MKLASLDQKLHKPDVGLLILRMVFGLIILAFGVQKLKAGNATMASNGSAMALLGINFWPLFWGWLSMLAETLGGLCILTGLFFRPVALILSINMAVALRLMWGANPDLSYYPGLMEWIQRTGFTLCFLTVFLALMFTGPGKFALRFGGEKSGAAK